MKIQLPEIPRKRKGHPPISGVYRIIFDGKWVYIGSSRYLSRRIGFWKHVLNTKRVPKNMNIKHIITFAEVVIIEIVEITENFKKRESEILVENDKYEFLLNRTTNAYKPINLKSHIAQPYRITKEKIDTRKSVAAFDKKTGRHLQTFDSINKSEIVFGKGNVREFFNGHKLSVRGCVFRLVSERGNFVPFKIRDRKMSVRPKGIRPKEKPVLKLDLNGHLIKKYNHLVDAANDIGVHRTVVWRVVAGKRSQTHGFIFKYA